jgi:hypothetical protein
VTGESGLGILRAVGGAFLVPFSIVLLGVVVTIIGTDVDISGTGALTVEYLLLEKVGTLKLGVVGEPL